MLHRYSLLLVFLLLSFTAHSRELLAVGTTFPGIFEQDEKGNFSGLGVDLVKKLSQAQGDTVTFKLEPWARAQETVARGAGDILIGPYMAYERMKRLIFMDLPFYEDNMVFFVNAASGQHWDGNYASLLGKRIGTIRGWVYGDQFDRESVNLSIEVTSTIESAMLMLVANRMQFLAVNERNAYREFIKPNIHAAVKKIAPPIGVQYGYLAFPKNGRYADLPPQFNATFSTLVRNGQLAAMAQKYGGLVKIPSAEKAKSK